MGRKISKETHAEAIRLRVHEQLSTPVIARRLGICNQAAYKLLHKHPWLGMRIVGGARASWSGNEIKALVELWPTANRREIEAALPRRRWESISKKASSLDVRRPSEARRTATRTVHPLIQQLVDARTARRMTIRKLAATSGHHPVETHEWETGKKTMRFLTFIDLANALGFDVVLRPRLADANKSSGPDLKYMTRLR